MFNITDIAFNLFMGFYFVALFLSFFGVMIIKFRVCKFLCFTQAPIKKKPKIIFISNKGIFFKPNCLWVHIDKISSRYKRRWKMKPHKSMLSLLPFRKNILRSYIFFLFSPTSSLTPQSSHLGRKKYA
jgi:hypothetical protein